ncbi:MAG TPA: prolipoprotein diacylglyceryl transferase [Syntrophobacter fumaroxidans]|nr:prolipoprotein diacylglyceryl transferase [Syntrophobacter fumaroxidans]
MIPYPNINPEIVSFGPFNLPWLGAVGPISIRWYGVMYVVGFVMSYVFIQKQKRSKEVGLVGTVAQDLIFYLAVGLIIGARLGYVVFYEFNNYVYYLKNPLEIMATWHGGMSFHGGLIGAVLAAWIFSRRRRVPFGVVVDSTTVTVPIGLGFGRIGNFINAELLGLPSDVPWAMVFPTGGPVPRHPTQLYEALLEGLVLFVILWNLRRKPFRDGMMLVFFLFFYGLFRFILEFFKEPDPQIGYLLDYFTMGHILCFFMIVAAVILGLYLNRSAPAARA